MKQCLLCPNKRKHNDYKKNRSIGRFPTVFLRRKYEKLSSSFLHNSHHGVIVKLVNIQSMCVTMEHDIK